MLVRQCMHGPTHGPGFESGSARLASIRVRVVGSGLASDPAWRLVPPVVVASEGVSLKQKQKMKNTRFTWKTLISGKNHGNRKFHYEQLRNTIRTIKPDLVWECAETTISAERIQT